LPMQKVEIAIIANSHKLSENPEFLAT